MKKILGLVLAVLTLVAVTACNKSGGTQAGSDGKIQI